MDNQIVPRRRHFKSPVELVLQHLPHLSGRVRHKARTSLHGFLGKFRIEVVQPAIAAQKQHLLGIPSQWLAFERLAFDSSAKHELGGNRVSRSGYDRR